MILRHLPTLVLLGVFNAPGIYTAADDNDSADADTFKVDTKENNATWKDPEWVPASLTNICPEEWTGTLPHSSSSTQYYNCEKGAATTDHCRNGLVFNSSSGHCQNEDIAKTLDVDNSAHNFCSKQVDGLYPNHTQNCQQFSRCKGGRTVSTEMCPLGEALSYSLQTCLPQNHVSCVRPVCHALQNDFFWMPGSFCRSYYFCQGGTPLTFICPEGKVFSPDTKDCVKGGSCYEPICTGRTDGDHPDTTSNCQRFMRCKGGTINEIVSCPPKHLHNGQTCLPELLVQCDSADNSAVAVETVRDDCNGYSDGSHVIMGTSCHRYQVCQDGKVLARLKCPANQRFNGRHCASKQTTPCHDPCKAKPDGYHADHREGCRKYHYCRSGETTERRSCPDGSLFSGQMCLPSPLVTCEQKAQPPKNPCLGLPNGFHADYLHGCSDYYYCSGYNALLRASCLGNLVWNGDQCVQPRDTSCLGPRPSTHCHGRRTGLYPDLASGCTKYFYCHNGNQTLLACPKGKVFDGEICMNADEYTCPSREPDTCYNKTDGYRTEPETSCRGYYSCSNGDKISFVCPGIKIYNGKECVNGGNFTCPYSSNMCERKLDGYYPVLETLCRKYYYCQGGYRLTTLSCGPRKAFDGSRCVIVTNSASVCQTVER